MGKRITYSVLALIVVAILVTLGYLSYQREKSAKQAANREQQVNIGIVTWAGFAVGFVGEEKGFFPGIELITRVIEDAPARQAAFASGQLDIMISSVDLYAQEAAKGLGGKIILVTDESYGGDGIVATRDIQEIGDLRGKTIAYAHGGPSDYLLFKVLDSEGIGLDEVEKIPVDDPSRAGEAFLSGSVQAAVTWEPYLSRAADAAGGHVLLTTRDYPGVIVDVLVANEDLANDGELLSNFLDGWIRSVEYTQNNPADAAEIMAKGLNIPKEDVVGLMEAIRFAGLEENKSFFSSRDPALSIIGQNFNEAGEYWHSIGTLESPVSPEEAISSYSLGFFSEAND